MRGTGPTLRPLQLGFARAVVRSILASRSHPAPTPVAPRSQGGHDLARAGCELLFDPGYYLGCNPDVAAAGVEPRTHYFNHGEAEGRNPHPLFNTVYYRMQMGAAHGSPGALAHFATAAVDHAFDPHPMFDLRHYAAQVEALPNAGRYLLHYTEVGWRHGLSPHPSVDGAWCRGASGRDVAPLLDLLLQPHGTAGATSTKARLAMLRATRPGGGLPGSGLNG